jgi:hypothetical protein
MNTPLRFKLAIKNTNGDSLPAKWTTVIDPTFATLMQAIVQNARQIMGDDIDEEDIFISYKLGSATGAGTCLSDAGDFIQFQKAVNGKRSNQDATVMVSLKAKMKTKKKKKTRSKHILSCRI